MVENRTSGNHEQSLQPVENIQFPVRRLRTWPLVVEFLVLGLIGAGGVLKLFALSTAIADVAARYNFIAQNVLSLCIFLAVVAQAIIYFSQRGLMKEQWTTMQGQLGVANKQIDFMVLSECAYIAVGDLEIPPLHNHNLIVTGKLYNGGRTPAWDIITQFRVALAEKPPPVGWVFDWPESDPKIDKNFLVASDDVNFSTKPLKITDGTLAKINDKKLAIFLDGLVTYFDTMGGKQYYTFGFTMELLPGGGRAHSRYQHHERKKAEADNPN